MPELSRFFGIVIGMFYREHGVPHFHAVYGDRQISVEVETLAVHGNFRRARWGSCLNGPGSTGQNCWRTGSLPG